MDPDFATSCPLVRPALPRIRFLFVGSRFCSTLPSDSPSGFPPCVSLVLPLNRVPQGISPPKLSDMSDTQEDDRADRPPDLLRHSGNDHAAIGVSNQHGIFYALPLDDVDDIGDV